MQPLSQGTMAKNACSQQADNTGVPKVGTSTFQAHAPSKSLKPKPRGPSESLDLDLGSAARAYFLSSHVIVDSETVARGQYEFLSGFLAGQQDFDPALYHALNAAAFATFGNSHNIVNMLQKSRVECNLAIQAVNTALQSPETAAKDSTMIAAMLIWTFETVTFVYGQDVIACIDQLSGGMALLMIRGPQQLNTRLGFQIFLQAYFLIASSCIQQEHALPPPSPTLRSYVQPYLDACDYSWRILDLMARFADLLDSLKNPSHQFLDGSLRIISVATKLDDDFHAVSSCLPLNWQYQTFHCSDTALVYNGIYHIYHDAWVIRYWNYIRVCRIRLQRIILDNSSHVLDTLSQQYQTRATTIAQLSTDICATVPQHAGYLRLLQPQPMGSQSSLTHTVSAQREAGAYTAGIYYLLYPLFAIGRTKSTPIQQREWIINRLECLGRISGISQAFAAADTIKFDDSL
ncbi:hypothetical protein EG329_006857 [Mollisiaceae sp. DMI_Dod_QoI]|nr:hypothetical protein EG329_006857 [Helotiales sp. DMI_Dod_QoI]